MYSDSRYRAGKSSNRVHGFTLLAEWRKPGSERTSVRGPKPIPRLLIYEAPGLVARYIGGRLMRIMRIMRTSAMVCARAASLVTGSRMALAAWSSALFRARERGRRSSQA